MVSVTIMHKINRKNLAVPHTLTNTDLPLSPLLLSSSTPLPRLSSYFCVFVSAWLCLSLSQTDSLFLSLSACLPLPSPLPSLSVWGRGNWLCTHHNRLVRRHVDTGTLQNTIRHPRERRDCVGHQATCVRALNGFLFTRSGVMYETRYNRTGQIQLLVFYAY